MTDPDAPVVRRLNHAVLFVADVEASVTFYAAALGMQVAARERLGAGSQALSAVFLRLPHGDNHHDLGLFPAPVGAPHPPTGSVTGLYHLAWEVAAVEDLARARTRFTELDALVGESDHGATLSLYAHDPDGNELEVMWMLPRQDWGEHEGSAPVRRLDLVAALARYGG